MFEIKSGDLAKPLLTEASAGAGDGFAEFLASEIANDEAGIYMEELEGLKPQSLMKSMQDNLASKLGLPSAAADLSPVNAHLETVVDYLFEHGARDPKDCIALFCKIASASPSKSAEPMAILEAVVKFIKVNRDFAATVNTNKQHANKWKDL